MAGGRILVTYSPGTIKFCLSGNALFQPRYHAATYLYRCARAYPPLPPPACACSVMLYVPAVRRHALCQPVPLPVTVVRGAVGNTGTQRYSVVITVRFLHTICLLLCDRNAFL